MSPARGVIAFGDAVKVTPAVQRVAAPASDDEVHDSSSDTSEFRGRQVADAGVSSSVAPVTRGEAAREVRDVARSAGFMRVHVKSDSSVRFREAVEKMCGARVSRTGHVDIALVRFTAATVPVEFEDGRDRLRRLAVLGDAALCAAVCAAAFRAGHGLSSIQQLKNDVLTDKVLSSRFAASELAGHVSAAGGVALGNTKTGATALEAVAGVLYLYTSVAAVERFAWSIGVLGGT
jgi:hypothetical protein